MIERLAVCSWSLQPDDPGVLIDALEEIGVLNCQLALGPLVDEPDVWADSFARLRQSDITVISGMLDMFGENYQTPATIAATGGVRPDDAWPINQDRAAEAAVIAGEHNLDLVTFHAGFIPHEPCAERAAILERLRVIVDLFAEHDVRVGLETGQETAVTLLAALGELDRPSVGVNFDPANMLLYGMGDPIEALEQLAPHVVQTHIKDATPPAVDGDWGVETPVGEGQVDWPAFFDRLHAVSPPPWLVIEREAGDERRRDIATARDLVRACLIDAETAS